MLLFVDEVWCMTVTLD